MVSCAAGPGQVYWNARVVAAAAVVAILDEHSTRPFDLLTQPEPAAESCARSSRYDSYEHAMFIVAEESELHGVARRAPGR
jgi:hypothetical protein